MATRGAPEGTRPLASILIGTRNRVEPLIRCLESVKTQTYENIEVVVLDDASDTEICKALQGRFSDQRLRWMRSETPSGVAGARNKLIQRAQGEILIFLDDDAFFEDQECIERAVSYFGENPEVGIIAFQIILRGRDEGKLQVPFSRRARKKDPRLTDRHGSASYYVGAAHAVRKQVFDRCGLYQHNLVYGHEELDLSYAAIQRGFRILYVPDVVVSHVPRQSVIGERRRSNNELFYNARNRIWIGYKHLPWPYFLSYIIAWSAYYGARSLKERNVLAYIRGVTAGLGGLSRQVREPLRGNSLSYVKSNFGRLWY